MTEDEPRTGTTVWRASSPAEPRHGYFWLLWPVAVFALVLSAFRIASAAEPASRPHEITLLFSGKDYPDVRRTHTTIGLPYESREACRNAITRVRIELSGVRLVCTPAETRRVK